jgi:hypothetical protein
MRIILLTSLISFNITGMNQIIPTTTPESSLSSDEEICAAALEGTPPELHKEIMPYLLNRMRQSVHDGQNDVEQGNINALVLHAVNDVLEEKERQITSRISKKHSAFIAIATGVLCTTITALAAIYNTTYGKC